MYARRLTASWAYVWRLRRVPDIVIDAPNYTYLSSGTRCLHLLCDRLNHLGFSAAVTARKVDPRQNTPQVRSRTVAAHPDLFDRSIVIYPEVVAGNPLRARNVVRYLLNKPGLLTGVGIESYGERDYYLHFADEFRPHHLASRRLRPHLVDTSIFTPPPPRAKRDGFLVYSHRHQPDIKAFPAWISPVTVISRATPRDPQALARLYQSSRALIVGERTAAVAEALHCHCPVLNLPHPDTTAPATVSFPDAPGVAFGLDQATLDHATAAAPAFAGHYAAQSAGVDAEIRQFVADAASHFGLSELQRMVA